MERRNSLEITAEILTIAESGAKKSHIAYRANLNHKFLGHYLDRLEEQGLIKKEAKQKGKILATEKGVMFAQQYRNLLQFQSGNQR